MATQCLACGERATVREVVAPFEVESGGKSKTIPDRRMTCGHCGNISYRDSQISEHETNRTKAIRELEGLLSE